MEYPRGISVAQRKKIDEAMEDLCVYFETVAVGTPKAVKYEIPKEICCQAIQNNGLQCSKAVETASFPDNPNLVCGRHKTVNKLTVGTALSKIEVVDLDIATEIKQRAARAAGTARGSGAVRAAKGTRAKAPVHVEELEESDGDDEKAY